MTATGGKSALRSTGFARYSDRVFGALLLLCGLSVLFVLGAMVVRTVIYSAPVFQYMGITEFIFGQEWIPGDQRGEFTGTYGAWPFIWGTLYTSTIAVVLALPLAISVSIYVNFYASSRVRTPLSYTVEVLAAVPSVIFGMWGLKWFIPTVVHPMTTWVASTFGTFIPWLREPVPSVNYFHAGLVLAIMILPIITAIVREVMATTPVDEINAAYGLGSTRWEVVSKVIVPRAFSGIVGATMLGLGRALGETIAVLMLVGGSLRAGTRLFFSGNTLAGHIAGSFPEASSETLIALMGLGVVLFLVTMVVNMFARVIVWRFGRIGAESL